MTDMHQWADDLAAEYQASEDAHLEYAYSALVEALARLEAQGVREQVGRTVSLGASEWVAS